MNGDRILFIRTVRLEYERHMRDVCVTDRKILKVVIRNAGHVTIAASSNAALE